MQEKFCVTRIGRIRMAYRMYPEKRTSQSSPPPLFVMDLRQWSSHASCCTSKVPPKRCGNDSRGICNVNWGMDTVNTLSLNFSRTNNRRILKGALNHNGAVTISTFFSFAGYPPWNDDTIIRDNAVFSVRYYEWHNLGLLLYVSANLDQIATEFRVTASSTCYPDAECKIWKDEEKQIWSESVWYSVGTISLSPDAITRRKSNSAAVFDPCVHTLNPYRGKEEKKVWKRRSPVHVTA